MVKKQVRPNAMQNDWMAPPIGPSFSPFDFDVKPTYNPLYNIDINGLGLHGERAHPRPMANPHSGYLGATQPKPKSRSKRARMSAAKIFGIGIVALAGYGIFNLFEK